jgi:hypothetical protein
LYSILLVFKRRAADTANQNLAPTRRAVRIALNLDPNAPEGEEEAAAPVAAGGIDAARARVLVGEIRARLDELEALF